MKIYDCISYLDEDLLLDLRLNILNDYVDFFVIVEGNKTWQNNFKKFRFDLDKFKKFKEKIIYIQVKDMPDGTNPWVRENFQRNWKYSYNELNDQHVFFLDEKPFFKSK